MVALRSAKALPALLLLACLALAPGARASRALKAAVAPAQGKAARNRLTDASNAAAKSELCRFLAVPGGGKRTLIMSADPGDMSGVPETAYILGSTNLTGTPSSTAWCPQVDVGTLMGQPVAIATSGINAVAAAACVADLLACAPNIKEIVWLGTSGWSPQPGGVLNPEDCSEANQSPAVTRLGDVCVSPLGLSWCFKSDWSAETAGVEDGLLNSCSNTDWQDDPADSYLFGDCQFANASAESVALADEVIAAARDATYPQRSAAVLGPEGLFWETMSNSTGVSYDYVPEAPPTVWDYTQCTEIGSTKFWSGHPWEAQARHFVADAITTSGLANVTFRDVVAVSAMEANGLLYALDKFAQANGYQLPVTIVRANSNYAANVVQEADPGVWTALPKIEAPFGD